MSNNLDASNVTTEGDARKDAPQKYKSGDFYQLPKNLHLAVKSPYEFAVLRKLLQHADGNGYCFPSQITLSQGLMLNKIDDNDSNSGEIVYTFSTPNDNLVTNRLNVHYELHKKLKVESPLEIAYDPANPERNIPVAAINSSFHYFTFLLGLDCFHLFLFQREL